MKKIKRSFIGPLGTYITRHLELHRSFGSLMNGAEHTLLDFDRYMAQNYTQTKTVTRRIVIDYLKSLSHLNSNSLHTTLTHLRKFCAFLFAFKPQTYIPQRGLIPAAKRKVIPYIYTDRNIIGILNCAKRLEPYHSLRPLTYVTILSLLWVSGLRIREVLSLNLGDIDHDQGLLYVRKTKFSKSRIIPLSPSTLRALKTYLIKRADQGHDQNPKAPVFINQRNKRCTYVTVSYTFRKLIRHMAMKTPQGTYPRLHDIRHSFATRWLFKFYKDGQDASAYLPVLATYLGHVNINCTQVYLHPGMDLLTMASQKFHQHALKQEVTR